MRRAHYTRIGTVLLAGALLLPTGAMAAVFNVNDTSDLPDANLADGGVGPTCFEASYSSPLRNETGFYKAKP